MGRTKVGRTDGTAIMVRYVRAAFDDDVFEVVQRVKERTSHSWREFVWKATKALAEQEGIEVSSEEGPG